MTTELQAQHSREQLFHRLHHSENILLLPNIWDPLGALLLADLGYPAIATSSAAIAWSNGYPDGEKMPFETLLRILKRIVSCVSVPVTADIERAFAGSDAELRTHIRKLIDTGIAGINYEDSLHDQPGLLDADAQCRQIEIIRETATACGAALFLNARIDVYLKAGNPGSPELLPEAIRRGKAYREAGADGIYPILLKDAAQMGALVQEVGLPVNVTLLPGSPDWVSLKRAGVARLSLASGFLKAAATTLKHIAASLKQNPDFEFSTADTLSYDYLAGLVAAQEG